MVQVFEVLEDMEGNEISTADSKLLSKGTHEVRVMLVNFRDASISGLH